MVRVKNWLLVVPLAVLTAVADRADGLVARLAAGAVQQQVNPAGDCGAHLPGPAGGVIVEDLGGAQAAQVVVVGRAGHAEHPGTGGRGDLHGGAAHASRGGGDEHGLAGLQPPPVDQALMGGPGVRR